MIIVFMVYVIPKIQDMYKDARVNLPELTQVIINISNFLQKNLIELIIGVIIFISVIIFLKNHPKTKIYFDHMALRVPLF
jgi:type IV pilus assembly protein PilC